MAGLSVAERCLTALNHLGRADTGRIADAVRERSGIVAGRLQELRSRGLVRRLDDGEGRGSIAEWEVVR